MKVNSSDKIYNLCDEFKNKDREHVIVVGVDTQNQVIYKEVVFIGTLNQSVIHPREIFKRAIMMSCASIFLIHNHPGGTLEASYNDLEVTRRIKKAGKLLGIDLKDHLIITNDSFFSFRHEQIGGF